MRSKSCIKRVSMNIVKSYLSIIFLVKIMRKGPSIVGWHEKKLKKRLHLQMRLNILEKE